MVSIHVPARGTTLSALKWCDIDGSFNPRSRTGNDGILATLNRWYQWFQSTFPHGERQLFNRNRQRNHKFQSTFPHGERLIDSLSSRLYTTSFNPRSRTGNDTRRACTGSHDTVSIHVPARGTTLLSDAAGIKAEFQSTFPHGERRARLRLHIRHTVFQSTFPHGERHNINKYAKKYIRVSIHVPARGTTQAHPKRSGDIRFQSTFPHGERHTPGVYANLNWWFQSTFPHGERPKT